MFGKLKRASHKVQLQVVERTAGMLGRWQHRFGAFMNGRTQHWSVKRQKWFLVIVVVAIQLVSLSWFFMRLTGKQDSNVEPPAALPHMLPPPSDRLRPVNDRQAAAIHRLRLRLDAMALTKEGRDSLAQLQAHRPGFIDSVRTADDLLQK